MIGINKPYDIKNLHTVFMNSPQFCSTLPENLISLNYWHIESIPKMAASVIC